METRKPCGGYRLYLLEDFSRNGNASVSTLRSTADGLRFVWSLEYRLRAPNGLQQIGIGPPVGRQHNVNPSSKTFWSLTGRSLDRSRRRLVRARASHLSETMGPISPDSGSVLRRPSDDDELMPAEQYFPPLPFPAPGCCGAQD